MKCLHAIVVASIVALGVLVPSSASARSYTIPDPAHDVIGFFEGGGGPEAAPTRAEGDVLASGVAHRPRRVIVAMRYAAMTQTTMEAAHTFLLTTNEGKVRRVTVMVSPGHWGGTTYFNNGHGDVVRCKLTTTLSYAQRRATVSIPRRCLSSPRWVRVGMQSMTMEQGIFYLDDGQSGAPLSGHPVFGPRVRRG